jgi:tetratricopeptide (TPR) repeat protein
MPAAVAPTYHIFVSSPSDVLPERERTVRVIRRLNGEFRDQLSMSVTDYTTLTFAADHPPQADIREAGECDLVIGILWSRLGTPLDPKKYCRGDGRPYESGTAYEIETSLKASRQHNGEPRVVLFRKITPLDFTGGDPEEQRELQGQARAVDAIIKRWTVSPDGHLYGSVNEFDTSDKFEEKLETGIRQWLEDKGHKPRIVWNIIDGPPFPGLRSYTREYAKVFFGRDEDIRLCRQALAAAAARKCAFLTIIGASGSGKSSLARAGLTQRVAIPVDGVNSWLVEAFTPGAAPLAALGRALAHAVPSPTVRFEADANEWAAQLRDNLDLACAALVERLGAGRRMLLIVDQMEEAFDAPAEGFTAALAAFARSGAVWVVGTLRVDRYADFCADRTLLQLKIDGAHYDLIPPDFNAIVRGPVTAAGLEFERNEDGTDLGTRLVRSAGGRDALPLLQMALLELFEARSENVLTFDAFDNKLGGLAGAISRYADTVLASLDEVARQDLRPLLLRLTRVGPDGAYYSRPMNRAGFETSSARRALVTALLDCRLLVADREELRVSHEALLRNWQAAQDILRGHERLLRVRDRLEHRAQEWSDSGRESDELLPPSQLLFEAEAVLDDLRATTDAELLVQFIAASIENRDVKTVAVKARLAADEQKITDHMAEGDFTEAKDVLTRTVDYLTDATDADLDTSRTKLDQQLVRVRRLAEFSTAAARAMTLAGEELFESALDQCEASLKSLRFGEDPEWWQNLPTQDLQPPQAELLRRAAYRALLLLAALRLVPGIVDLFGKPTPGPPGRRSGVAVQKLAGLIPSSVLLKVIVAGRIGPFKLPLPTRQDKPAAATAFQKCLDALAWVARVEDEDAMARGTQRRPSRASFFLQGVAEVLQTIASGPAGAPINYRDWLGLSAPDARPEPVNAADYFFIGLLNFYVAKRRDTALLAKIISLFQLQFPDVDARTPLDTADRLLRSAVALEPQHFWPHWVLGRVLSEKGDYVGAELAFNAAIAVGKDYSRGYEQRALVLGWQWKATHEPALRTRAEEDSATAMALADGDPSIFWPRGELFQRLGESRRALDAYTRWLELEHDLLGTIARGAGVSVLDALGRRMARESDRAVRADAHALLAWVHLTRKEFAPALDAAEAALLIDPMHPHALTAKGIVLCERHEPQRALALLDLACDRDSLNYRAALHLAQVSEKLALDEEAQAAWNTLEEMSADARVHGREQCPDWILQQANQPILAGLR